MMIKRVTFGIVVRVHGPRGTPAPPANKVRSPRADRPAHASVGVSVECRLDCPNALQHLTFGFVPRFHEAIVRLGSALPAPGLEPIRSISDTVAGDGIQ